MNNFEYASPDSVESAVQLLGDDAAILAGGTDLLSLMKDALVAPKRVVNIKGIPDLRGIQSRSDGSMSLGALVTVEEILSHPDISPALRQAAEGIRSPQIESMGTVAGDLCQRPRCWYFRNGFGLLAMRDGESMIPEGDNRYHAILGNSGPAYFVCPSSFAPALVALGASLQVQGPQGTRTMPLVDLYRTPTSAGEHELTLASNEVITSIEIPAAANVSAATYEVRHKEAMDWPLTAAAVALRMNGSTVESARVVLGHVAPGPWLSEAAGSALAGKQVDVESAEAAGAAAVEGAQPLSRNQYKVRLTQVAVKRAVLRAGGEEIA